MKYTPELGDRICERIATCSLGLDHIAKEFNLNPSTLRDWYAKDTHDFSKKYARAKVQQMDYMAEEIIEIADDGRNDLMTVYNAAGEPKEVEDKEVLNRSRLRVDSRKWLMSKLAPKKYGDKVLLGSDPNNPLPAAQTLIYLPAKGSTEARQLPHETAEEVEEMRDL